MQNTRDSRINHLDDALRYLIYCCESNNTITTHHYSEWAIEALSKAGEYSLAHDVLLANDLNNPALYDAALEKVRNLKRGELPPC